MPTLLAVLLQADNSMAMLVPYIVRLRANLELMPCGLGTGPRGESKHNLVLDTTILKH